MRRDGAGRSVTAIKNDTSKLFRFFNLFCVCFVPLHFIIRPLLKQIKNSAEKHIVLDCTTDKIYQVLKQAQQIGMMTDYHSYLITSLVS